jgi:formiminotetrahydrofolate cyclodeaminase
VEDGTPVPGGGAFAAPGGDLGFAQAEMMTNLL